MFPGSTAIFGLFDFGDCQDWGFGLEKGKTAARNPFDSFLWPREPARVAVSPPTPGPKLGFGFNRRGTPVGVCPLGAAATGFQSYCMRAVVSSDCSRGNGLEYVFVRVYCRFSRGRLYVSHTLFMNGMHRSRIVDPRGHVILVLIAGVKSTRDPCVHLQSSPDWTRM